LNDNNIKRENLIIITKKNNLQIDLGQIGIVIDGNYTISSHVNKLFNAAQFDFFINYLPFCFNYFKAIQNHKTYVISHFAQSLDGKIATNSGHSKWIGNEQNLIHAHRMRALCNGILIGANTLKKDKPMLTVRHVEGDDPVKIVLCNSCQDFIELRKDKRKYLHLTTVDDVHNKDKEAIYLESTDK